MESFSDFSFIFDVRVSENTAPCEVLLRGSPGGAITIDPALYTGHLAFKGKGWNRFEGLLKGTLQVDAALLAGGVVTVEAVGGQ
jgi:hypothetical protein